MKQKTIIARTGLSALAAALSFSSTPLLAQSADPIPTVSVPVVAPAASEPVAASPAAVPEAQPPLLNIAPLRSSPSGEANSTGQDAPTVATKRSEKLTRSAARIVDQPQVSKATAASEQRPPAPIAAAKTAAVENLTPAAASPAPPIAAAPESVAPSQASVSRNADDNTLPIAAGAGVGILLLAGGAIALGRRKREEEPYEEAATVPAPSPLMARETGPSEAATATHTPSVIAAPRAPAADVPVTEATLPAGFDLSRFGPHVQQAYRGPTPDNPSASLKKRLHRAAFFDQRERRMAEGNAEQAPSVAAAARTARPEQPRRDTEFVTTRIGSGRRPDFKPAYQG